MQKLFAAALRAPAVPEATKPTRAVPGPATVASGGHPTPAPLPVQIAIEPTVSAAMPDPATPPVNAGLDAATSAELAALLDAQNLRKQRKRRRDTMIAALVLLGFTGAGFGWFIHSPQRVKACREAINDIRSVGDIGAFVAKYNKALEKVKVRSTQIDDSTSTMGIDPSKDGSKDPYFEKEMREMAAGEGKTLGERNRLLKERYGSKEKNGPTNPSSK